MASTLSSASPGTAASEEIGAPRPVNADSADFSDPPLLTILVPTRHEEHNVGPLLDRLDAALADLSAQILIVDDSDDATAAAVAEAAAGRSRPVLLLERPPGRRPGGLSGAVLA